MIHLNTYSHYSNWESILRIPELVAKAKERGHSALALTDIGNMSGAIPFYRECKKNDIKPIFGQTFYYARDVKEKVKPRYLYKIVLLAQNLEGYQNLIQLSTKSYLENFYYVPKIGIENLEEHNNGLYCLVWDHFAMNMGDTKKAWNELAYLDEVFLLRLHYEARANSNDAAINRFVTENVNIDRVVATVPMRYASQEDFKLHDIAYEVQANFTGRRKKSLPTNEFYYMSDDEIFGKLKSAGNAALYMTNADILAKNCNVELDRSFKFPKVRNMTEDEAWDEMYQLAEFELLTKIDNDKYDLYKERLDHEAAVVKELGFSNYFLTVQKIINGAKRLGVEVGPGRGSVCGSVLAWLLGIHSIDPLEHGLFFERFLNKDRVSMPDIDIDFDDEKRDEVLAFISETFGEDKVVQICTFSTLALRGAMKDASRAFKIDFSISNAYSKIIPEKYKDNDELMTVPEFKQVYDKDTLFKKIIDTAFKLEGQFRQPSVHAAAVIIAPDDITKYIPLQKIKDRITTQYDMYALEYIGLVKMDCLGLRTLSVIRHAVKGAGNGDFLKEESIREDMEALNDTDTFSLIRKGDTVGVFQIEDGGMSKLAKEIKVSEFKDIADLVALYRPAVMQGGLLATYLSNRKGKTAEVLHELVEDTFADTYGVPLYQESLMKLAQEMGGFTATEADTLRKAIGKKELELLQSMQAKFITGSMKNGVEQLDAQKIWATAFEGAANYGFNKCLVGETRLFKAGKNENCEIFDTIENLYNFTNNLLYPGTKHNGPCLYCGAKDIKYTRGYCKKCYSRYNQFLYRGLQYLSYDEKDGRIRPNKIKQIYKQGKQTCWTIATINGKQITGTRNHKLLTDKGWKCIVDIDLKDKLAIHVGYENYEYTPKDWLLNKGESQKIGKVNKAFGTENYAYAGGGYIDLMEWTKYAPNYCEKCGDEDKRLERAHLDGDRTNNDPNNLMILCVSCHKKHDYKFNKRNKRYEKGHLSDFEEIAAKSFAGERETYDVEMEGPNHNFIANGIVSHNSHAVAYGKLSYMTAYLKRHYPLDFYAALLTSVQNENKKEDFIKYLKDVQKHKIPFSLPDINVSKEYCFYNDGKIILSLSSVKHIGIEFAKKISDEREKGKFKDIFDFVKRIDPNITQLNYLCSAQAVPDALEYLEDAKGIIGYSKKLAKEDEKHKGGMFDIPLEPVPYKREENKRFSETEVAALLQEATGFIKSQSFELGIEYTTITDIIKIKHFVTKKNRDMAYVTIKTYPGFTLVVFPKQYSTYKHLLAQGKKLKVNFTWQGEDQLILQHLEEI